MRNNPTDIGGTLPIRMAGDTEGTLAGMHAASRDCTSDIEKRWSYSPILRAIGET